MTNWMTLKPSPLSAFWHALWKDNGCPRSGTVFLANCQTALHYKKKPLEMILISGEKG